MQTDSIHPPTQSDRSACTALSSGHSCGSSCRSSQPQHPHTAQETSGHFASYAFIDLFFSSKTNSIYPSHLNTIFQLQLAQAERIVQAREQALFDSAEDLARRAGLEQHEMTLLAAANALMSLSGHRRQQVWEAAALRSVPLLLRDAPVDEEALELPAAPEGEAVLWDFATTGLTLRWHPLALLRPQLSARKLMTAADLHDLPNGHHVRYCGIVTLRQQPDTAGGVVFVSLEDETGVVQVIVWKSLREKQRKELLGSRLLAVRGRWQREGEVRNLIAGHLEDLTALLGELSVASRDFH